MEEQARAERLADAIDRVVLEGGAVKAEDQEMEELLALALGLQRAMPFVQADPTFRASLRSRLLARRSSWWRRPRWSYSFAAAAVAVLVVAAVLMVSDLAPRQSGSVAAQPTAGAFAVGSGPPPATAPDVAASAAESQGPRAAMLPGDAPSAAPRAPAAAALAAPAATDAPTAAVLAAPAVAEAPTGAALAAPSAAGAPMAALPSLPPLSASMPRLTARGLGGGAAENAGERDDRISFQLETKLPDLGSTTTVYRYRQPVQDTEKIHDLATGFGFDPSELRPVGSPEGGAYVAQEPGKGSLEIQGSSGPIVYHSDQARQGGPGQDQAPPDAAWAVEAAARWLDERGLLPSDAGTPSAEVPFPQADFVQVAFRPAQPANIVSSDPRVLLSVGSDGVRSCFFFWPEMELPLTYPARTADSAWNLLESGKAEMHFTESPTGPDLRGAVRVTSVDTGYFLTFDPDDRPYLQPVVIFGGEATLEGDPEAHPFSAQVPLVADSALSGG